MEERKSMGGALVDVFDAGVVLVKSEINGVAKKVGDLAKAKGIGVVLLLAAVGPLVLGLIFLILAVFYLLMVWLPAWGAALVIALLSFAVTVGLAMFGVQKLSAHVDTDMPRRPVPMGPAVAAKADMAATPVSAAIAAGNAAKHTDGKHSDGKHTDGKHPSSSHMGTADSMYLKDMRVATGAHDSVSPAENRVVYESKPDGEAQLYGSGLNKKLDEHHADPNLQNPVVLRDGPGINVSTTPTYRDDMKREGY